MGSARKKIAYPKERRHGGVRARSGISYRSALDAMDEICDLFGNIVEAFQRKCEPPNDHSGIVWDDLKDKSLTYSPDNCLHGYKHVVNYFADRSIQLSETFDAASRRYYRVHGNGAEMIAGERLSLLMGKLIRLNDRISKGFSHAFPDSTAVYEQLRNIDALIKNAITSLKKVEAGYRQSIVNLHDRNL